MNDILDVWQGNYKYFSEAEMRCKCGKCNALPKHSFMCNLEALRVLVGMPLVITSGARCLLHNKSVNGGPAHPKGVAADISAHGNTALKIITSAYLLGFKGVGVSQNGSHISRFIHVDMYSRQSLQKAIWSY